MSPLGEFEPLDEPPVVVRSKLAPRLLLALVILAAAGAALWWWKRSLESQGVAPIVQSKPAVEAPPAPPPPAVAMTDGDTLLRQLGARLSSAPELAKWLAEADIVRRLVAAVNLIAEGNSPRPVLGFLGPAGKFEVQKGRKSLRASPQSYARYDTVARVLTSVDAAAAGNVYGQMKPYLDAAFAEIGRSGKSFDGTLRAAIAKLEATPIPSTEPELEAKGSVGYGYVDPKLEELSAAQKHLLRMGSANARAIQTWLKKFDGALPKTAP